jgi:hypothetical protein
MTTDFVFRINKHQGKRIRQNHKEHSLQKMGSLGWQDDDSSCHTVQLMADEVNIYPPEIMIFKCPISMGLLAIF